jgi:diacylglycerol kinase
MKPEKNLHPRTRLRSIGYSIEGCIQLVKQEPNAKIHALATVVVIIAGVIRQVNKYDWIALVFAIAIVWLTEALNTTVEMLCDLWCKEQYHPTVKIIKDIASAAVWIACMASIAVAVFVFFF